MLITTGFGYYIRNGLKIAKYELPIGTHPDPDNGIIFVEVPDQATLDTIVIDPLPLTPEQQQAQLDEQIRANRDAYIDALISGDTDTQQSIQTAQTGLLAQKSSLQSVKVGV
jgi:hypothetical protein